MTVLFCDLVGFTAASDAADPEDVRARIRPYHARLRQDIERYGGTVEKFIGDAVMAVFGAPSRMRTTRSARCGPALRILEAIEELNEADPTLSLQVRIGIGTGEAVVALGARPERGRGDRHRRRRQHRFAAAGGSAGERHRRARSRRTAQTERVFDYEELEPVAVKGKAEPLPIYRPLRAARPFRLRRHPDAHHASRRSRAREDAPDRDVRAVRPATLLPAA